VSVALSGALPKEWEDNGLGAIVADLLSDTEDTQIIIAAVRTKSIKIDVQKDNMRTPTIEIVRIEAMTEPRTAQQARQLLRRTAERRTGVKALPLPGLEDNVFDIPDVPGPDDDEGDDDL
jgi:hypothetical protein